MRIWSGISMMLLTVLVVLSGCDGGNAPPAQSREGQQVPVLKEFQGTQGPFPDRGVFVVQRPDVWASLWDGQRVPDVDFSRQTVLVALMGQQQTAGYAMRISDVRATGQQVVAYVMETRPAPGPVTATVITNPYHMVVVPKITQPVSFVINDKPSTLAPIIDVFQGTQSKMTDAQTVVIRDRLAWNRLWNTAFGATAVPEVDFATQMAVGVFIGRRSTGGYAVAITSVERIDDRLTVKYRVSVPQPGQVVTQAVTYPYAIAIIPASTLPVSFQALSTPVSPVTAQ